MKFNPNTEKINYIKIVYKDSEDFSHCIKATVKNMSEKEIYALVKCEKNPVIITPQEAELSIASDNGIFKAKSILKYTQYDENCLYLAIEAPKDVEFSQNREYFRVKLNDKAYISFQDDQGETKVISCLTEDISANGVKLILNENTEFPEQVELTLNLLNKNIKVMAKYVRTEIENEIIKASFNFVGIKESDQDYISQICLQKQLEVKRKMLL